MSGSEVAATEVPAGAVIVDLRPAELWAAGHAPGALNFPISNLAVPVNNFSELERIWGPVIPHADPVYLIGDNGIPAGWLAYHMMWAGRSVRAVAGGMPAWIAAGLPVEAEDTPAP